MSDGSDKLHGGRHLPFSQNPPALRPRLRGRSLKFPIILPIELFPTGLIFAQEPTAIRRAVFTIVTFLGENDDELD
jgi:hypothetical protein